MIQGLSDVKSNAKRISFQMSYGLGLYGGSQGLEYPCTNESLDAINLGMGINGGIVVSVGGSGDVPFVLSLDADKVYAVDNNRFQVRFMDEQKRLVELGNFDGFCRNFLLGMNKYGVCDEHLLARKEYFLKKFKRLRMSMDKVEIIHSDIFSFLDSLEDETLDGVYLSNIFDYEREESFCRNVSKLSIGGVIYSSRADRGKLSRLADFEVLNFNKTRTKLANKIEAKNRVSEFYWNPVVYNRVA